MDFTRERVSSAQLLASTLEDESAAAVSTAKALGAAVNEVVKRNLELESAARAHDKQVAAAKRRTARCADALRRIIATCKPIDAVGRSAVARAKKMAASLGEEPAVNAYGVHLQNLIRMAGGDSWDAITFVEKVKSTGNVGRTVVMWKGDTAHHPREVVRFALREVFEVDVDSHDGGRSFFVALDDKYGGDDDGSEQGGY